MKRVFAIYLTSTLFGIGILVLNFFTAIALSRGEDDVAILFGIAQIVLYVGGIVIHALSILSAFRDYERARGRCYRGRCVRLADDTCLCDWE